MTNKKFKKAAMALALTPVWQPPLWPPMLRPLKTQSL